MHAAGASKHGSSSTPPPLTPNSPTRTTASTRESSFHFNPLGDLLHAFQSAMLFGRKSRMKESPSRKLTSPNTITVSDTLHFEHIELAQFSRVEFDPTQTGIGHDFSPTPLHNPTWCDLCGDVIWSLYQTKESLKCQTWRLSLKLDVLLDGHMGLIESISLRDGGGIRNSAPAVNNKRRPKTDNGQPYFFYDVNKNSVGIFNGNDTIVRRFQTGHSRSKSSASHPVPTASSIVGYDRPKSVIEDSSVQSSRPSQQNKWSSIPRYDNLVNIVDFGGEQLSSLPPPFPPPPPPPPPPLYEEVQIAKDSLVPQDGKCVVESEVVTSSNNCCAFPSSANDENCNYTCHERCHRLVTLNCKTQTTELGSEFFEVKCEESCPSLLFSDQPRGNDLQQNIEKYNANLHSQGYEMEMQDDGETFHGFIRVHMNLSRPINVLAGCRPPSIYDIMYEDEENTEKTLTSFYLPRDTVKALHVTSEMTTQELISALLRKFKVVDNPRKYCLYEKYWEGEGSVKGVLRRMQDHEKPLWLVLLWGLESMVNKKLVLQENDTGDIMWEAFTLPELSNFLRILDREEEEYLNQVRLKYKKMEAKLCKAMKRFESHDQSEIDDDDDDDEDDGGFLLSRPTLAFCDGSR